MRWKSGLGRVAVAAIALTMIGAPAALAEDQPGAAEQQPEIQQPEIEQQQIAQQPIAQPEPGDAPDEVIPAPCLGVTFPLQLDVASATYTVTQTGDDEDEEGTLRWALAQANAHPGIDEIIIGPDVKVLSYGDLFIQDELILRGANEASEIVNISQDNTPLIESHHPEYLHFPLFFENLIFSGSLESEFSPGVDLTSEVCSFGAFGVTMRNFSGFAVKTGDVWPFLLTDVRDSTFTGTRVSNTFYEEGTFVLDTPALAGAVKFTNTDFIDNDVTGLRFSGILESFIDHRGSLTVENSRFINNRGLDESAGGLGIEQIEFSDFEDWTAIEEGAPTTPVVAIRDTLFRGNTGPDAGGMSVGSIKALSQIGARPKLVSVERSTFIDNSAEGDETWFSDPASDIAIGTARFNYDPKQIAFSVSDSTLSTRPGSDQPNIRIEGASGGGRSLFQHVTLAGGGVSWGAWGETAEISLANSVFDTGDKDPVYRSLWSANPPSEEDDEYPVFTEANMAYTTAPELVTEGAGRIVGPAADFLLGELDDTQGPTPVRVPDVLSPLVGAGGPGGEATDQRGFPRPQGTFSDIGSIELPANPATIEIGADQTVKAGDALVFEVTRELATENPWTGEASVRVTTTDGTAKAGADFTAVDTLVSWPAEDAAPKTFSVPTDKGHAGEGDVQLTVTLSDPNGDIGLGARVTATGTIERDADTGVVVPPKPDPSPKPDPKPTPDPDPTKDPLATSGGPTATAALIAAGLLAAAGATALYARRRLTRRS